MSPPKPRRPRQGRSHVGGFVADLTVGKAKRRQARAGMRVVAPLVARLLERSAVVAQAGGLDHGAEGGPVEVDPVSTQPGLRLRHGQASFEGEWRGGARD